MAKKQVLLLGFALAACGAVQGQTGIGEVFSGDTSVRGSVLLSAQGTQVVSGSQVSAGDGAALLKLKRGGEVRICPNTNLSVSSDASGKELALGLSAGSMELNYTLLSAADLLMTPDLRLQLISPGTFHLAISVSSSGDTCLRTLPGNDAAVFVAEMMGGGSYQLTPGKSVMFGGGKISRATTAPEICGCPESAPGILTAKSTVSAVPSAVPAPPEEKQTGDASPAKTEPAGAHLAADSSFTYRGDEAVQDFYSSVSRLSLSTDNSQLVMALLPRVTGPSAPAPAAEKKTGFLHWLGHLFSR